MSKTDEEEFEVPEFRRDEELDGDGVSEVVIERFVKYRLPLMLEMKQHLDEGRELRDGELELLTRWMERARNIMHFVHEHPEYKELAAKIIDLLHDMTEDALENARKNGGCRQE